jgi:hypothetical protein
VALTLTQVDTDSLPELSRNRIENDLMKDPAAAARDLQSTLNSIPAESEEERSALLQLIGRVGTNPLAVSTVETILNAEIQRRIGTSAAAELPETRVSQLIDNYSTLVRAIPKQMRFLRSGIAAQPDSRVNRLLVERLESLQMMAPPEADAPGE